MSCKYVPYHNCVTKYDWERTNVPVKPNSKIAGLTMKKERNIFSFFKVYAAKRNKKGMSKAHQEKSGVPAK